MGQEIRVWEVSNPQQFDATFAAMVQAQISAVLVPNSTLFTNNRDNLVALAARYVLPAAYEFREFVIAGGLFSYGSSNSDSYRLVGTYVGRILKGEKPAELPVVRPTKFEFFLNLKTAKALGIEVPRVILLRADEIIE